VHNRGVTTPRTRRPRYTVRKQSSGRTFSETFYVYDLDKRGRVSVHAGTRESAQADADRLNASHEQHLANLADPAWIADRDAKLAAHGLAVNTTGNLVRLEDAR
jgi:hypothetical protein